MFGIIYISKDKGDKLDKRKYYLQISYIKTSE